MPMFTRLMITSLALLLAFKASSIADPGSPSFVRFVHDDSLPKALLDSFLKARHVGDYRVVEIDTDALRQTLRDAYSSSDRSDSPTISLPLIDGALVKIELRGGGESHSGWQAGIASFLGRVAGDEYSSVQCVITPDGSANLTIRTAGHRYKLEKTSVLPYHVYWSLGEDFSQQID